MMTRKQLKALRRHKRIVKRRNIEHNMPKYGVSLTELLKLHGL